MNEDFIRTEYPWFYPTYTSYDKEINRADAARVFYMYKYGGMYADLDFLSLKPIDTLLQDTGVALGSMGPDRTFEHSIPNAWMASKAGHRFWMACAEDMIEEAKKKPWEGAEYLTGPVMLFRVLKKYNETSSKDPVTVLAPHLIYPYSWDHDHDKDSICSAQSDNFDAEECIAAIDPDNRSYAVSFWSHSWEEGDGSKK